MKALRKISTSLAAIAMVGSSLAVTTTASAGVFSGLLWMQKGILLQCHVEVDLYDTPGKAIVTISPGDAFCAALSITSNDHDYTYDPITGELVVEDVTVSTITDGDCRGDISGIVTVNEDGSKTLTIDETIEPVNPETQTCYVWGDLFKPPHVS